MKKIFSLIFVLLVFFVLQVSAQDLTDAKAAKNFLAEAIELPQQAFSDAKTLYVKESMIVRTPVPEKYKALAAEYYGSDTDFIEGKVITETYRSGNKFRISSYENADYLALNKITAVKSEAHLVFDGKTLTLTTSYSPKKEKVLNEKEILRLKKEMGVSGNSFLSEAIKEKEETVDRMFEFKLLEDSVVNGVRCKVIERKATSEYEKYSSMSDIYYIDPQTKIMMKTEYLDKNMTSISEVKKTVKVKGKYVPSLVMYGSKSAYGLNMPISKEYEIKVDEKIPSSVFEETKLAVALNEAAMGDDKQAEDIRVKMGIGGNDIYMIAGWILNGEFQE